ncbi:type II toxin-antitoxin system CcdA family antitoxin [Yersinia massiliensis]|uniref:type II toxin-antitoxin system CcdA family antitoxin n=1 Tax=Yersinia massiliensis TaxID=419257 RepID=UPI001CFEE359|nr:type II toxin-antitoxin system CcdA family antitoxin [Yersinia massiliensis]MCB5320417.1 type II toxin-antitoxin system CcdA family antitoxin [Yersinia massiliensis]
MSVHRNAIFYNKPKPRDLRLFSHSYLSFLSGSFSVFALRPRLESDKNMRYSCAHNLWLEFVMRTNTASKKRNTNVYLNADLIEQAKALDLNLSATLNQALELAVKERQRERWLTDNRAGLEALNSFVEENGLFSDDNEFGVL